MNYQLLSEGNEKKQIDSVKKKKRLRDWKILMMWNDIYNESKVVK